MNTSYLFAYFRGEGIENGEQVYFAVSHPDRPLDFTELNGNQPVLVSGVGEGGVRDPYLVRNQLTGEFHLLATNLRIFASESWEDAIQHGSRSLVVWDSPDLIQWSPARLVDVAPPAAGCTWAPEAVFDSASGQYAVVWASTLYDDDLKHQGESHLRILASHTADFRTFSDAAVYFDPGYSVIDTTFIEHEGSVHRFSKDERPASENNPYGKYVFHERGTGVFADDFQLVQDGLGAGILSHGEGPAIVRSPDGQRWFLLIDEFSGRGYAAFESDDLDAGQWRPAQNAQLPAGARHGSLLPITHEERAQLLAAHGPLKAS